MGKGSRNRVNRQDEPQKVVKKKVKRYHRPLPGAAKGAIAAVVCVAIVVAIVFGTLAGNGTFKRGNILVRSKNNSYNINQQMATYMMWEAAYYNGYYYWSYFQDSIKQQTGITNQAQYCLYYAMNSVQNTLYTTMSGYVDTLKQYVAICDQATALGVSLSKEEIKEARAAAKTQIAQMAASTGYSSDVFLKLYIGCNVSMGDIQDVAEMEALYSKVAELKQGQIKDSVTDAIIDEYIAKNPTSFYSTDYLTTSTTDAELRDKLLAATTADAFKLILAEKELNEGTSNYKTMFNKNLTDHQKDASALLDILKGKNADTLQVALDEANTKITDDAQKLAVKSYPKTENGLDDVVTTWLTASARKAYETTTLTGADAIYVVVYVDKDADTEGNIKAAVTAIALDSGATYTAEGVTDGENFKANVYHTVYLMLGIDDGAAEDAVNYKECEVAGVKTLLADLVTAVTKVVPTVKTVNYTKTPTADSYQEWMFKDIGEDLASIVKAGDTKSITETKNNVDTYNVYMVVDPMKLDTEILGNGGYVVFDTEAKAQEFFATLNGLTGDALKEKFTSNSNAAVSEGICYDDVEEAEVSAWLASADRKANDTAVITVKGDKSDSYAVAFWLGDQLAWKYSGKNGYVSATMQDWIKEISASYEVKGLNKIKDKVKPETEEATTAAA